MVSFDVTPDERAIIGAIADRALTLIEERDGKLPKRERLGRRVNLMMDLTACHANGNPLRLADMLAADDFNFMHDVSGISRFIDHDTGALLALFVPRFSAPMAEA